MRMKKERLWWFRAHFSIDSCTTASRHIDRIKAQYLKHVVREQWINKCIDYNLNNGCWDHTCRPASLCCILKPCSGFISNFYLRIKITAYQINNRFKITDYEKRSRLINLSYFSCEQRPLFYTIGLIQYDTDICKPWRS